MSLLKSVYIFVIACTVGQAVAKNSARPTTFKRNIHSSQLATLVGASGSAKIDGLLVTSSQRKRQGTCEFPGGPICSATTCCRPGERCCPNGGCCPADLQCIGSNKCCETTIACGDKCCDVGTNCCPGGLGCCDVGANCCQGGCCDNGTTCCGESCCLEGEICERGECIDIELENSIVRFELDIEKNKELLENICEGMRLFNDGLTKSIEVLTYRGKEEGGESRGPIRKQAGCVRGYCSKAQNNGGNPANNSCHEYPPASCLQGGDARPLSQRIIRCLPQAQNSHQGQRFADMLRLYKAANNGLELLKEQKFVISIDCEAVALVARRELSSDIQMVARDAVSSFGNGSVDPDMRLTNNASEFVLLALGDLESGTYTLNVRVAAGATSGGYVFDSEGDEIFASSTSGLTTGQTQQYSFTLEDDMFGVALALITNGNDTMATFNLTGTTTDPSSSAVSFPTGAANPAISRGSSQTAFTWLGTACAIVLCILNLAIMVDL
ncbi:hypothetical protein BYT27DRAFT_7181483 [Phlegmacium glaucopus]|nr:hypothetical protein BYT27DRAFT_7181483 [Phlegmacium glaucopus]